MSSTYSASTAISTVFNRELRQNLLKKSSLITMILAAVMVVGGVIAANYFTNSSADSSATKIAVVGTAPFAEQAAAAPNNIELSPATDASAARAAVESGDVDAALIPDEAESWTLLAEDPPQWLVPLLNESLRQQTQSTLVAQLGGDPAQFAQQVNAQQISVDLINAQDDSITPSVVITLVGVFIMITAIMIFGGAVAMSVIEEKSSRVIEIMLATVRPLHLLTGKILGAALAGLALMLVVVISGAIAIVATGLFETVAIPWTAVALLIPCFILGYLFFAALYAAAASLVSRMEDFQGAQMPVLVFVLAATYIPLFGWQNLDSTFMQVAAWIPPVSITTAPLQYAVGNMGIWQLLGSLAVMVIGVVAVTMLAAKIYPRNVLHTGAAISWRKALTAES